MSNRTPEHYAKYSDKEIYDALCFVDPNLKQALEMQRNMLLGGWSEDEIFEALKRDGKPDFVEQLEGIQGHLVRRALHHVAVSLWAQQSSAPLN